MKTLQNNFTTPEQSNRLLELGVPADSADMIIESGCDVRRTIPDWTVFSKWCCNSDDIINYDDVMPCWSVGRLMEIAHICSDSTLSYKEEANKIQKFKEEHKCETLIDAVVVCITDAVSIGSINFSKLEE